MKNTKRRLLSSSQFSVAKEIDYIVRKAKAKDSRIVQVGSLVLFSTQTGDAWILDPEDMLALCVARNGEREDYEVSETDTNYQIHWNAKYKIQDDIFIVSWRGGRTISILGYPARELQRVTESS